MSDTNNNRTNPLLAEISAFELEFKDKPRMDYDGPSAKTYNFYNQVYIPFINTIFKVSPKYQKHTCTLKLGTNPNSLFKVQANKNDLPLKVRIARNDLARFDFKQIAKSLTALNKDYPRKFPVCYGYKQLSSDLEMLVVQFVEGKLKDFVIGRRYGEQYNDKVIEEFKELIKMFNDVDFTRYSKDTFIDYVDDGFLKFITSNGQGFVPETLLNLLQIANRGDVVDYVVNNKALNHGDVTNQNVVTLQNSNEFMLIDYGKLGVYWRYYDVFYNIILIESNNVSSRVLKMFLTDFFKEFKDAPLSLVATCWKFLYTAYSLKDIESTKNWRNDIFLKVGNVLKVLKELAEKDTSIKLIGKEDSSFRR